jgi:prepilin-type processing-associated H-X9-DG protein
MSTSPEQHSDPPQARSARRKTIIWGCALVLGVVFICGGLLWWPVREAREAARRADCIMLLKVIGLAMHNYHDQHGCFPPAYFADKEGQPMHSWRVLVLPYMEAEQLYDEYSFDEPWDSPNNLALARNVPSGMVAFPSTYLCPSESEADPMHATYLMLVGPGAFSDGPHGRTIEGITDGSSNTIMIAERSRSGIHWMEPRDLNVGEMSYRINDPAGYGIRSPHPGLANALFADGTVHSITEDIDPEVLKALITINAGDAGSEYHSRYER